MLNGKLDFSFELVENKELIDGINIVEKNNKLYSLDVVNVKYTKKYKSKKVQKTTKELKDWTYIEGFSFNDNLMINWKRSGGKARVGENLFIIEKIKNVIQWARMGLKFEDKVDIAGIRAYESLPLSSIIGCVEINPKNILVINDYTSEFDWIMSKTWLEKGELQTKTIPCKERNSIWDGEGLLNVKIFNKYEFLNEKGVALLRNRFMKCAGFSCELEKYYKKYCEEHELDYNTFEIEDMYGNSIKVKDIELITTPSAIKLAKFNKEVLKIDGYKGDGAWLQYWKDNCGNNFGVCKTEKPSHYENGLKNRLSYQMVNTIPFTKDELKKLVDNEITYIEKLKSDLNFFLQEVNQLDEEMCVAEDETLQDELKNNKICINIDVTGAFIELSKKNPNFVNTQVFKNYRRSFINSYIKEIRQGKLKIDADYCVACGNPIELLKATTGDFDGSSDLKENELYCSRFENGQDVVGFRNPHINVANIGIQKNKHIDDLKEYMNDTPNIVFLNSIKYPILSTYQGEDFDIDSNLLTSNEIIVTACKRINKNITPIPVNFIENTGSNNSELTGQNMSDVDMKISKNYIGSVINLSQEINSLYNHLNYNNLASTEELEELYQRTSRLSSMSQCEIDKAKKQFEELNVQKELDKMKQDLKVVDESEVSKIKEDIKNLQEELKDKKSEIKEYRKDKRKPINKEIRTLKKSLEENYDEDTDDKIKNLQLKIIKVNLEREDEIEVIKNKIRIKHNEKKEYDCRRIKPYFFKYIGDNEAKKQRLATNKKYRRELDKPIIHKFCKENNLDIKKVDKKNKKLQKLLKVNDTVQKEWEEKIYDKEMDTPMNWLNLQLDSIKNAKKIGTTQVITLVKKNTNKPNELNVNYVVNLIKNLDVKIKAYKLNIELKSTDKSEKIKTSKQEVSKDIKKMKLSKADLYWVLRKCLNSVKNNRKIDKKSGIESLTLEILFEVYGTKLLDMFIQE